MRSCMIHGYTPLCLCVGAAWRLCLLVPHCVLHMRLACMGSPPEMDVCW